MNIENYINIQEKEKEKIKKDKMKLIRKEQNKRCYKLDKKVTKDRYGTPIEPTNIVIVSDSLLSIERLVFPAYIKSEKKLADLKSKSIIDCFDVNFGPVAGMEAPTIVEYEKSIFIKPDLDYYEDLYLE